MAVGSVNNMKVHYSLAPIRKLEPNMTVFPGFYDSHGHIMRVCSFSSFGNISTESCLKESIYLALIRSKASLTSDKC
jgi:predicted amidohydrolase YtcJ